MAGTRSTPADEPKLTLPVGHPQAGYVSPDLSYHEGTGTIPDEEIEIHEERNEAREAEVEAVAENEHKVASDEQAKRDEAAAKQRERLEKVAGGEASFAQIAEAQTAQAALDSTEPPSTTSGSGSGSSGTTAKASS